MGKKEIIEILRSCKKVFAEQYDLLDISVFGSVARNEVGEDSDVDQDTHRDEGLSEVNSRRNNHGIEKKSRLG